MGTKEGIWAPLHPRARGTYRHATGRQAGLLDFTHGAIAPCAPCSGELADPEDLRAAVRARAVNRRATVLHRHLLRVLDLGLLPLLTAVALGPGATPGL